MNSYQYDFYYNRKRICLALYLASKSYENVLANFRRKYNFNNYPSKLKIHELVTKFQVTEKFMISTAFARKFKIRIGKFS